MLYYKLADQVTLLWGHPTVCQKFFLTIVFRFLTVMPIKDTNCSLNNIEFNKYSCPKA